MSCNLTEKEIISLIEKETARCMKKLVKDVSTLKEDVTEIKIALLGGDRIKAGKGLIDMVNYSYEHSRMANDLEMVPKIKKVVNHYEEWEGDGTWEGLETNLQNAMFNKKLIAFLGVGSLASFIALIIGIITVLDLISKL